MQWFGVKIKYINSHFTEFKEGEEYFLHYTYNPQIHFNRSEKNIFIKHRLGFNHFFSSLIYTTIIKDFGRKPSTLCAIKCNQLAVSSLLVENSHLKKFTYEILLWFKHMSFERD